MYLEIRETMNLPRRFHERASLSDGGDLDWSKRSKV